MQQKKCMQAKFDYAFFCLSVWGYSCVWRRLCDIKDLFFSFLSVFFALVAIARNFVFVNHLIFDVSFNIYFRYRVCFYLLL